MEVSRAASNEIYHVFVGNVARNCFTHPLFSREVDTFIGEENNATRVSSPIFIRRCVALTTCSLVNPDRQTDTRIHATTKGATDVSVARQESGVPLSIRCISAGTGPNN